jgi:uncharacterized Tic20 family protein
MIVTMLSDELAKLRDLHQQGELSDEEYTAAKAQLLNHPEALAAKDHPIVDYLYGMTPNTYAMTLHLAHYAGYMVPFAGFIVPIGMWLYAKDRNEFIHEHGRSSVNFIVSYFIYNIIWLAICLLLQGLFLNSLSMPRLFSSFVFLFIPIVTLGLIWAILPIFAAIAASKGQYYRYPFSFKLF